MQPETPPPEPDIGKIRSDLNRDFTDPKLSDEETRNHFLSWFTKQSADTVRKVLPQHCEDRARHIAERLHVRLCTERDKMPAVRLGEGGFGVVYKVRSEFRTGEDALKLLQPNYLHVADVVKRFEYEHWVLRQFEHSALPRLLQYGAVKGQPFYLMEFCGISLDKNSPAKKELLAGGGAAVSRFAGELFDVLALVHDQRAEDGVFVAHRDIKPQNILVHQTPKQGIVPKLIDFGIAQVRDPNRDNLTPSSAALDPDGKYTDPDFPKYGGKDARPGDIYSLGKVVLEDLLAALAPTQDVREVRIRDALAAIAARCCVPWKEGDGGERYRSAADVRDALRALLEPATAAPRVLSRVRREVIWGGLILLLVWAVAASWTAASRGTRAAAEKGRADVAEVLAAEEAARARFFEAGLAFNSRRTDSTAADLLDAVQKWQPSRPDPEVITKRASAHQILGDYYRETRRTAEAEKCFQSAIDLLESLAKQHSLDLACELALARAHGCLGDVVLRVNDRQRSEKHYKISLSKRRAVFNEDDQNQEVKRQVALAYSNFARMHFYADIRKSRDDWQGTYSWLGPIFDDKAGRADPTGKAAAAADLASSLLDHCCGAIAADLETTPPSTTSAAEYLKKAGEALTLLEARSSTDAPLLRLEFRMWACLLADKSTDPGVKQLAGKDTLDRVLADADGFLEKCADNHKPWAKSLHIEIVMRMQKSDPKAVAKAKEYAEELATSQDFFLLQQKSRFEKRLSADKR